ncbi:MAG TPA: glycosyl hydrolase family 28-related protein [Puia sp.]|nr:glycosyl hydrolase family 28-related protein [Puia sp.]
MLHLCIRPIYSCLALLLFCASLVAQPHYGATIPWITYEAEQMRTTGTVLGPGYEPYRVETESSGERCVKLTAKGQYVEFTAIRAANSLVIRYSLPDASSGGGVQSSLGIYRNGRRVQTCAISSRYAWLYGKYPFSNDPAMGTPRHFYDEVRIRGTVIARGDVIRIQRDAAGAAAYCIIDLVDLENVAPPLPRPANALSLADFYHGALRGGGPRSDGSRGDGPGGDQRACTGDYTQALRDCIAQAVATGKTVWIPAGRYTITGDIVLPDKVTIQGAGMWYSELAGNDTLYDEADKRVRLKGNGSHIHLADFAITGRLTYRSDKEPNDGIVGSYGRGSTISRIWIEHTKVGMWIENSDSLLITGCRMRNTLADGINLCVGMSRSTIDNCTARGTGDDCFAIWPTTYMKQEFTPGNNRIIHCTGQLPYLANGAAIYGGVSNAVMDCLFTDITPGTGILISTTFPTGNNNFSGTTVVGRCRIATSGGFDHEWGWRAAVEVCVDKRNIAGLRISDLQIDSSLSGAVSVVARNQGDKTGILSNAVLDHVSIGRYGLGVGERHALYIAPGAHGNLTIVASSITDVDNTSTDLTIRPASPHAR